MLLLVALISLLSGVFFYCQAFSNGLGRKRWAVTGMLMGPVTWPIFCAQKRMKINKLFGFDYLLFRA